MQCRKSFRRSLIIYMFLSERPASMDFISPESEHPASTDFTGPTDSGIVHGGAGTSKHWCSGGGPPVRPETQTRCFVGRSMTASHYGTPGSRRTAACAARNRNPVTFRGSLRSVFVWHWGDRAVRLDAKITSTESGGAVTEEKHNGSLPRSHQDSDQSSKVYM